MVIPVTGWPLECVSEQVTMLRCFLPAHTYSLYHRDVFMSQFATGNPGPGYYLPGGICSLDSSSGIKYLGPSKQNYVHPCGTFFPCSHPIVPAFLLSMYETLNSLFLSCCKGKSLSLCAEDNINRLELVLVAVIIRA